MSDTQQELKIDDLGEIYVKCRLCIAHECEDESRKAILSQFG